MRSFRSKLKSNLCVFIAFAAFAIINYPMSQRELEATLLFPILAASAAFIIAIIGVAWQRKKVLFTAIRILVGYILAFVVRLFGDVMLDPTSHNLFPLEMILIAIYSFLPALLGGFLTYLVMDGFAMYENNP